ncbi:MAG: hypothetical protein FWC34_07035 [Bacteroidetes bacterium]|nr:hypothetical protein [Bacteroidota bacterium]MCL2302657.1 hypothetical protein [Lentimicrobiaceae bacterium]
MKSRAAGISNEPIEKKMFALWTILLLSGFLSACWKPKEYKYLIDQETKDYCLFGESSYWIYQDSATLNVDSVVIDKPFTSGEILDIYPYNYHETDNTILLEKKDYYSIDESTYSNVKIFKYSKNGFEKLFYWAKHVGIIRVEVYENNAPISVRNLVRYNVKPYKQ